MFISYSYSLNFPSFILFVREKNTLGSNILNLSIITVNVEHLETTRKSILSRSNTISYR